MTRRTPLSQGVSQRLPATAHQTTRTTRLTDLGRALVLALKIRDAVTSGDQYSPATTTGTFRSHSPATRLKRPNGA